MPAAAAGGLVTIRVYVVDDHAVVRGGLRYLLGEHDGIEVVGEAGTVAAALDGIGACRPDVAVVDVRLPDGNGVELVREIRSRQPAVQCLILTTSADDEAFFHAVVAGACGYLVKDADPEVLAQSVRAAARGESLIGREVIDDLRRRSRALPPSDMLSDLTAQERRILKYVAEGLTNGEIAARLELAEKTVRNNVSNILSKLGMRNRTELATHVVRLRARHGVGGR